MLPPPTHVLPSITRFGRGRPLRPFRISSDPLKPRELASACQPRLLSGVACPGPVALCQAIPPSKPPVYTQLGMVHRGLSRPKHRQFWCSSFAPPKFLRASTNARPDPEWSVRILDVQPLALPPFVMDEAFFDRLFDSRLDVLSERSAVVEWWGFCP